MKIIKSILILILLVGLPLGSWYFLKSGLEWRKAKVVKLEKKQNFINAFDFSNNDKDKLYEIMAHRTTVVKNEGDLSADDKAIIDQFENAYTFQFLSLSKTDSLDNNWVSKSRARFYKPQSRNSNIEGLDNWNYMIVDTSGYIRQFYKGTDKQVMSLLVEDIAVVLPRKKPKDIGIRKQKIEN